MVFDTIKKIVAAFIILFTNNILTLWITLFQPWNYNTNVRIIVQCFNVFHIRIYLFGKSYEDKNVWPKYVKACFSLKS